MNRQSTLNNSRIFTLFAVVFCYALFSNVLIASKYTYNDIFGGNEGFSTSSSSLSNGGDSDSSGDLAAEQIITGAIHNITSNVNGYVQQSTNTTSEEMTINNTTFTASDVSDTTVDATKNLVSFKRYDGVVIVTKVLSEKDAQKVARMLCFLQHSYNDKRKYDIVVFTTIPWAEETIAKLQADLAPTKLTVAAEGPPLMDQVAAMTPEEKAFLYKRCNVTKGEDISWYNYCTEEDYGQITNLGYAWQAEFRSYHIWTHEAIKNYKYMMWFDSDAIVGREWDSDPMEVMIERGLIMLYAAFPYGTMKDGNIGVKMKKTYNKTICGVMKTKTTLTLYPKFCDSPQSMRMAQIGGFHHITSLDVYRKPIHQQFLKDFVGDYRFSRRNDDQIAVTIPAIMEQDTMEAGIPRIWEERGSLANLTLHISHHGRLDGKRERSPIRPDGMFKKLKNTWPGLDERCGRFF